MHWYGKEKDRLEQEFKKHCILMDRNVPVNQENQLFTLYFLSKIPQKQVAIKAYYNWISIQ